MNIFSRNVQALLSLGCALALMTGLVACDNVGDDVDAGDNPLQYPGDRSVLETIQSETSLNTLQVAADTAGVTGALSGSGPYTIFVPPNAAFDPLALDSLLGNKSAIKKVIKYHVHTGEKLTKGQLSDDQELSTLMNGASLTIDKESTEDGKQLFVNGARVTSISKVENGIVYTIDRVLFPTISEQLRYTSRLQTLSADINEAGLTSKIDGTGNKKVTLFAPTNTAISLLGGTEGRGASSLRQDKSLLKRVLRYHIARGEQSSEDVMNGATLPTLQSNALPLDVGADEAGIQTIDGAPVSGRDYETANGVLHVIDQVLQGSMTITERAQYSSSTNSLVSALDTAGLADKFDRKNAGPFTVFAPTDQAFAGVNSALLLDDSDLTKRVLQNHVLNGRSFSSDLSDGDAATTLQGMDVSFGSNDQGDLTVNGVRASTTDIKTINGVLHLLDGVLLESTTAKEYLYLSPQTNDPTDEVAALDPNDDRLPPEDPVLDLYSVVKASGLGGALDQSGSLTLFAPLSEALANQIGEEQIVELTDSTALAKKVLMTHYLTGKALSASQISSRSALTVADGTQLAVKQQGGNLTVGDIAVVGSQQVSNGVVHLYNGLQLQGLDAAGRIILTKQFTTLQSALSTAGLMERLSGSGPFTVFAPIDASAGALAGLTEAAAGSAGARDTLKAALKYHVLDKEVMTSDIQDSTTATTLQGEEVQFTTSGDTVFVNGKTIVMPNLDVENGVLHGIDGVLSPPDQIGPLGPLADRRRRNRRYR